MAGEQSILDLALIDFSKLEPDSQKLINILTNVFETAEKFKTVFPIQVGVDSSWKELTQKQQEFKKGVDDISTSEMKAQKASLELSKTKLQNSILEQRLQNENLKGLELEEKANQRITKSLKEKEDAANKAAAANEKAAKANDFSNVPFEIKGAPDPAASAETIAAIQAQRDTEVEAQLAATEWAQAIEVTAAANGELDNSLLGVNEAATENVAISKEETKINAYLANDTKILSDAYNEASLKANNYALTLGKTHPLTLEAQADARALGQILKENDSQIGKNQRSVGDYGSAFSKAFSRATDSTRVINRVVSQLSRQVISLGTGMLSFAIGAKALELLGKGIEKVFDYAFPAVDKFITATDALDKTMGKTNPTIAKVIENVDELRGNVDLAKKGILDKNDVVKEYNDTMGKAAGQVKTLDEVEQKLVADSDAYIQMTIYKTAALEVLNEAAEAAIKSQKSLLDDEAVLEPGAAAGKTVFGHQGASRTGAQLAAEDIKEQTEKANKEKDNFIKVYEELMKKAASFKLNMSDGAKDDTGKLKKEFDTQGALLKIRLQKQIDYNADIVKNEKASASDRLQALRDEYSYKEQLLLANRNSTLKINREEQADTMDDLSRAKQGTIAYKNLLIDLKNEQGQAQVIQSKYLADKINLEREAGEAAVKFAEDSGKRIANLDTEIAAVQLKDQIKANEDASKNESFSMADRVNSYGAALKAKQDLIDQDFVKQKTDQGLNNLAEIGQDKEKLRKLELLQEEHDSKMHETAIQAAKDLSEITINSLEVIQKRKDEDVDTNLVNEKLSLYKSLKDKKDFNKLSKDLDDKSNDKKIDDDEDTQRAILNSSLTTDDAKRKAQDALDEDFNKKAQNQLKTQQDIDAENAANKKKLHDGEIELVLDVADTIEKIGDDQFEKEKQRLEEKKRLMEEFYKSEQEDIARSSLSAQQRAIEERELARQEQQQRRAIDAEIKKNDIEKAKFDRAASIAKIIANTAVGATKAYADGGIYGAPLAAIVIAEGALELAAVLATPIPSYAEGAGKKVGRPSHPGGLAEYAEAGPEVIEEPGKRPFVAFKPTIGHLRSGTDITPLNQFNPMLAQSFMQMYKEPVVDVDRLAAKLLDGFENQTQRITNAITNQKVPVINIHDRSRHNLHIDESCRK